METTDRTRSRGDVTLRRYDADALRTALPQWTELPKRQRLAALSLLAAESTQTATNIPVRGQHELLAEYLSTAAEPTGEAAYLAVGDDNSTSPDYDNETLNNEGYRTNVTDSSLDGTTVKTTTFLDSTEANDLDAVRELGLCTNETGGGLLNHALVDPEPKSSSVALTIDVRLSWVVP